MKLLSNFSVKRPVAILMGVLIIIILGIISLFNLTTELLPSINFPYAVVSTPYVGASPELVENTVTRPIESSMSTVNNIKNITSISRENVSIVILEFNESTNIDSAFIEVREKLDQLKQRLPANTSHSNIMKINPNMIPIMQFSISFKDLDMVEASQLIKDNILARIESVEGVANVNVMGATDDIIEIKLSDEKVKQVNEQYRAIFKQQNIPYQDFIITEAMLKGILEGQNIEMPVGYISEDDKNTLVRVGSSIKSMEELKGLPIISNPLMEVNINDIADVMVISEDEDSYSKVNGENAIIFSIQKQNNYPTSDVVKNIHNRLDILKVEYENMEVSILLDQSRYINMTINAVLRNLIYGALLAVIVLLFFLKAIKPTIIIGLAIPISVIATFILIYFYGITLNIISLGGLALGIGMLVDNAIVVIENIFRLRNEGMEIKEAAIKGASQVSGAITASTLTTISVFIPIIFLEGMTAEIFKQMALTVSFALFASLIIALTLVPMMASKIFTQRSIKSSNSLEKVYNVYKFLLNFSLKYKFITIFVALLLFLGSLWGLTTIGTEFIPTDNSEDIVIDIDIPANTPFKEVKLGLDSLMAIITDIEGVETVAISMDNNAANIMVMNNYIHVIKERDSKRSTAKISADILSKTKDFPYAISVSSEAEMSPMISSGIQLDIKGENLDELRAIAADFVNIITNIEGTDKVSSSIEESIPELRVVVDRNKSIEQGITNFNVMANLSSILNVDYKATTINIDNRQFDVNVIPPKINNVTVEDVENLDINGVLLSSIADIDKALGFTSINRMNQTRYVSVTADIKEDYNIGIISNKISETIDKYDTPIGYEVVLAGESEEINKSINALIQALLLAVLLVYMVMAIQFESLLYPFIIMFAVPLAFTGSFLALLITNTPLSIVALIGMIILAGIVVNNAIVLVDYINQLKQEGKPSKDALIEAGKTRMRPILMTSLTTILALTVIALGIGEGAAVMQPMAIATIGGLIFATLLTLIVIPCIYMVADNIKSKLRREI